MRFHVPQFIEVEPKIFGPLTFKQFIYILGGGALAFISWVFLPKFLAYFVAIPIAALSLGLAFYKVHGQPLINVLNNALNFYSSANLYIWKRRERKKIPTKTAAEEIELKLNLPKLTERKLKDLAWSLEIKKEIRNK